MFALYKLQAKVWFVNIFNKIDFFMVILFLAVMGSIVAMNMQNAGIPESSYDAALSSANLAIIGSITLMMVASSAINTFGMSFFEMKNSVLLKRIGATEITKPKAIGAFILWGMTSMVMIVGWMFLLVAIFQIPSTSDAWGGVLWVSSEAWANVQWAGVLVSIIIVMVSFYAIAFFLISISKDVTTFQMIGTFYFFLATMLGGSYTPNADRLWMDVIGFMTPLGWGGGIMSAALSGQDWWNIIDGFEAITFGPGGAFIFAEGSSGLKNAANIAMPILYGGLAGLASAKYFKWD